MSRRLPKNWVWLVKSWPVPASVWPSPSTTQISFGSIWMPDKRQPAVPRMFPPSIQKLGSSRLRRCLFRAAVQVDDPSRTVVVPGVLWIVAEVFSGHVDQVAVGLVVTQFVDSVGH